MVFFLLIYLLIVLNEEVNTPCLNKMLNLLLSFRGELWSLEFGDWWSGAVEEVVELLLNKCGYEMWLCWLTFWGVVVIDKTGMSLKQVLMITFCYCCSVARSNLTLYDPMDCSTSGFPVLHYLLEFPRTHVHWVSDASQPFHPLMPSSPPAFSLSQHQGLFNELALCIRWPEYLLLWYFLEFGV